MKKIIYNILCFLTLAIFATVIAQQKTHFIELKKLNGETREAKKPELNFDNYKTAQWQNDTENHLRYNFGFREILIRFYNQYLWDFYRKTYSNEVTIGKDNWLFFTYSVNEFYGNEMYRWCDSNKAATNKFERQVEILNKLRGVLKSYDIDFMVFTSPEKSTSYPEFLPEWDYDTTTIHAYDYYRDAFAKTGFPYLDMHSMFQNIQDTIDFPIIPQASAHWIFPAAYAGDSLFRFMAQLKGINMPHVKFGGRRENSQETKNVIHDLEFGLNLMRPIELYPYDYHEREVTVVADSNSLKTNGIFIGNSYFRAFNQYIPLEEIFSDVRYWFYNKTEQYGPKLMKSQPITQVDILQRIMNADFIVFFNEPSQMYKISYGFAEKALIKLCVSDSLWDAEVRRYMEADNYSKDEAEWLLRNHPLLIKGLDTEGVPTIRNERGINIAKAMNKIENDGEWMKLLDIQSTLRNEDISRILKTEAENIVDGRPLMRNEQINDSILFQFEIQKYIEEFKQSPEKMKMIENKAKENGKTLEEMMRLDAIWMIKNKNQTR